MKRRTFIAGLGSAAAWPVVARAQEPDRMRRIGVLMNLEQDDPESQARLAAFRQALQELGWVDGRNILMEYRWGAADVARARKLAAELIALAPDVVLASASPTVAGLQEVTRAVPIIFVNVIDAVGAGFVESMARPGGNTTGFTLFEYSISGKWLEILKQIAPRV
jgi:putative ABC transport system substrate-binding protein